MGTREASKERLAKIRYAESQGPAHKTGPFAHAESKASGLTPARARDVQDVKKKQDRVGQEQGLGMTRGRGATYSGD